jgi:hypothetical protein
VTYIYINNNGWIYLSQTVLQESGRVFPSRSLGYAIAHWSKISLKIWQIVSIFLHCVGNLYRQITRNCKRESYPLTLAYHLEPLVMHTWCPPMTSTAKGIAFSPRLELCWKGNSTARFSVFVEPITTTVRHRLKETISVMNDDDIHWLMQFRYTLLRSWYYDWILFSCPGSEN